MFIWAGSVVKFWTGVNVESIDPVLGIIFCEAPKAPNPVSRGFGGRRPPKILRFSRLKINIFNRVRSQKVVKKVHFSEGGHKIFAKP